jgi:tripartite-type tricarboxylate transporter receptor subunit TctC
MSTCVLTNKSVRSFGVPVITCGIGLIAISISITPTAAEAQSYPSRPSRFIVPFPPGGSTDIYARIIGPRLADALHQQVVIDNRPGAGGALGADLAAKAAPDGYTIWLGQTNNLAIGPAMRSKNSYDPVRDFTPITLLMRAPQVLVVNAGAPIASIKNLIAAAKLKPGTLTFASAGIGSSGHITGELLNQTAGVKITHVPYKGASPAMIDLRGGRVTYLATSLASAAQSVKDGKIKAIATTGAKRARLMPDVPTVSESGVPGFEVESWHGILAPALVPRDIIARLNREIVAILGKPEVREALLTEGGEITTGTPEAFAAFLKSEVVKWAGVIKESGITAE